MEPTLGQAEWRKSSYSGGTGNCVEVAGNLPGITAVRDSQDPNGPALILTPAAWRVLTLKVRNGELDLGVTARRFSRRTPATGRLHSPGRRRTQVQPGGFADIGAKPPGGRACTAASLLLAMLPGDVVSPLPGDG
jgi:Domain of unknown function (DUF397)